MKATLVLATLLVSSPATLALLNRSAALPLRSSRSYIG